MRPPASHPLPDQEAWDWSTLVTRDGRMRAKVWAAHFQKFDAERKADLDGGIKVEFFDSDGKKQASVLTAERGEIEDRTGDMTVSGHVLVISQHDTRLETDSLRWHRSTEQISGDGRVTIRRPGGVETGVGFEAPSDLSRWSLHHVTTRLGGPDSLQH